MVNLSIIIVSYNTKELTTKCLQSIYKYQWKNTIDIWVVDNASSDGSVEAISKKFPKVKIIASKDNLGFAAGNNLALKKAKSEFYLLLNSDTEVMENSFDNLLEFANSNNFGICSCKVLNKDGSFQPNGGDLPEFLPLFFWLSGLDDFIKKIMVPISYQQRTQNYYKDGREMGWVSGSVMLIKKEVLEKIGLLDKKIFMYGEDVEFCLRAKRAGFKIGWTDKAQVVHLGGGSSKTPKYNQWLGEFKGLLYVYQKYYGWGRRLLLKILIYFFVMLRSIAFVIIGKFDYAKTYAKIIYKI